MNEKRSYTEYLVVGTPQSQFAIGFEDYNADKDMIKVTVDNKDASEAGYDVVRNVGNTLEFTPPVPVGKVVRLQRVTDIDAPFYIFTAGNAFAPSNVDQNFKQLLHAQQEVRDGFDKLQGDVIPLVEGLPEALEKAQNAADEAQASKEAAEEAAQTARSAANVKDDSDLNQQQINTVTKAVRNVVELRLIKAKANDIVRTVGHTVDGLGSGTFKFEPLSAKVDNNGAYIASTIASGTWVLISEHFIEQFGVLPNGLDQSARIQAALDFYLANSVRAFGFEKSNKYSVSTPVRLKQVKVASSESYADPKLGTIFSFNGAYLEALTDNLKTVVVSRDNVQIKDLVVTTNKVGVIGVYNGLDVENNDLTLRRSSMRMILVNPKFERTDIAMKFEPAETKNGNHWGSFYHCIYNPHAVATNIMFEFKQSIGDGGNSNTRNTVIGGKHVGGACTVFGEALESTVFIGLKSEFITRKDSRLPNGEAVVLYLPYGTPSDYQANRANRFISFDIEVCTNYINVNAPNTHIDGFHQGATNPRAKAWIYNNAYDRVSEVQGGTRIAAYNKTPRLGLLQVNDDGTFNGLYIENLGIDKPYKFSADNGIEFGNISYAGTVRTTTDRLSFMKKDGSQSFYIDYTSPFFPILGSTTGELGLRTPLIPTDANVTIGNDGSRIKRVYAKSLNLTGLEVFANNSEARNAGWAVGEVYRTAIGQVMVVF